MQARSKVAIIRTSPATVLADTHRAMNAAGYQDVVDPAVETALKINISWHFFYPACSTTPWQLEGVIRTLLGDGLENYEPLFGAGLPYTDPEPVLSSAAGTPLTFYGTDDPTVGELRVVKDLASDSVRLIELP